jgi:hypothetical protein
MQTSSSLHESPLQQSHGLYTLSRPLHNLTTSIHSHGIYWNSQNPYWHNNCFYYTNSAVIAINRASSCSFAASRKIPKPLLALLASKSTSWTLLALSRSLMALPWPLLPSHVLHWHSVDLPKPSHGLYSYSHMPIKALSRPVLAALMDFSRTLTASSVKALSRPL